MMFEMPREVEKVIHIIEQSGEEAVIVGGPVRDLLLGIRPHDWDVATSARPEMVMDLFEKTVPTGVQHGTVTVIIGDTPVEVTTYRCESTYKNHRTPSNVAFVTNLNEDLKRRDFTINAMAYHPRRGVVDLFDGRKDLDAGIIRAVGDPFERFEEDALRMLRAVRFACRLNYEVEQETLKAICEKAPLLQFVSRERIASELISAVSGHAPQRIVLLYDTGLSKYCLPELSKWEEADWTNAVKRMEAVPAKKEIRLAALFAGAEHSVEQSAEVLYNALKRLKLDRRTIDKSVSVTAHQRWGLPDSRASVKRLLRSAGDESVFVDIVTLMAARAGMNGKKQRNEIIKEYETIIGSGEPIFLQDLAISGADLVDIGVQGIEIGTMLKKLLEWVTDKPEENERQKLLNKVKLIRKEGME